VRAKRSAFGACRANPQAQIERDPHRASFLLVHESKRDRSYACHSSATRSVREMRTATMSLSKADTQTTPVCLCTEFLASDHRPTINSFRIVHG